MLEAPKADPRRVATDLIERLRRLRDPVKADSYQRYFKEPVRLYGIGTPAMRRIQGELVKTHRAAWTVRDAVRFCDALGEDPHLEARGTGFQVVAAFVPEAGADLLDDVKRWLERCCGNWALVDNLSLSVLAPLLDRHPASISEVITWTGSRNPWLRRGAVVGFVPLARRGERLTVAYRIVSRLLDDPEDLMHKAMGWLLREAGKRDPERLERYLLSRGPRLPRTTLRYAIERFPKADRRRLLQATR